MLLLEAVIPNQQVLHILLLLLRPAQDPAATRVQVATLDLLAGTQEGLAATELLHQEVTQDQAVILVQVLTLPQLQAAGLIPRLLLEAIHHPLLPKLLPLLLQVIQEDQHLLLLPKLPQVVIQAAEEDLLPKLLLPLLKLLRVVVMVVEEDLHQAVFRALQLPMDYYNFSLTS